MLNDDQQALITEIIPHTLRSLFVLRISLCVVVACLAVAKICLVPPAAGFFLDLLTNNASERELVTGWMHGLDMVVSGLLATALALVIATFFIQARLQGYAQREAAETRVTA